MATPAARADPPPPRRRRHGRAPLAGGGDGAGLRRARPRARGPLADPRYRPRPSLPRAVSALSVRGPDGRRALVGVRLCGRVWTLGRDYPAIAGADDFLAWNEPGTVRVLFAHWIEDAGDGRSTLFSESRVEPVDRRARLRMRGLWAVIGGLRAPDRRRGPTGSREACRARDRVARLYGYSEATQRGQAQREEGAIGCQAQADAQELAPLHADGARQGGVRRPSRRRAHPQGARGESAQAEHPRPLEDGQERAEARGRPEELVRPGQAIGTDLRIERQAASPIV